MGFLMLNFGGFLQWLFYSLYAAHIAQLTLMETIYCVHCGMGKADMAVKDKKVQQS